MRKQRNLRKLKRTIRPSRRLPKSKTADICPQSEGGGRCRTDDWKKCNLLPPKHPYYFECEGDRKRLVQRPKTDMHGAHLSTQQGLLNIGCRGDGLQHLGYTSKVSSKRSRQPRGSNIRGVYTRHIGFTGKTENRGETPVLFTKLGRKGGPWRHSSNFIQPSCFLSGRSRS